MHHDDEATPAGLDRREVLGALGGLGAMGLVGAAAAGAQVGEAPPTRRPDRPMPQPVQQQPGPGAALTPEQMGWDPRREEYVLPPLPYAPEALEPHIDAQTMGIHHGKHHKAYVDGMNRALT